LLSRLQGLPAIFRRIRSTQQASKKQSFSEMLTTLGVRSNSMNKIFARFLKDESGATAIEYGLIAALIALAIVVGATALGNQLGIQFNNIATTLQDAQPSSD
jgi:pilus assembly protein Flp/PilA